MPVSTKNYIPVLIFCFVCPLLEAATTTAPNLSPQERKLSESMEMSRSYLAKGTSWNFEFAEERRWHKANIDRCKKELAALRGLGFDI